MQKASSLNNAANNTDKLKLLKKVPTLFEAHAIRGHLESHDITSYIPDEMTIANHWHLQLALGDFRIMVHNQDYQKAISLLQKIEEKSE